MKVSTLCLGTNMFGNYMDEAAAVRVMHACKDNGINFVDTSDSYSRGASEAMVGKGIKGARSHWIVATKVFSPMGDGPNDRGASRKHIMDGVEASLRRMETEYIDLYQIHFWDPETPLEETLRTLDDLVCSGKVRYVGCSNYSGWQLLKSMWVSKEHNFVRYESVQPAYNLLNRAIEQELLPACKDQEVGVIPYQVLMGGLLTGRYKKDEPPPAGSRFERRPEMKDRMFNERVAALADKLGGVARKYERTQAELLLGWSLANPVITSAIVGCSKPEQVVDNARAVEKPLTKEEVDAINALLV
jgi:aryl-alcohol dehydrogenase-like predicted oxidoreductase